MQINPIKSKVLVKLYNKFYCYTNYRYIGIFYQNRMFLVIYPGPQG